MSMWLTGPWAIVRSMTAAVLIVVDLLNDFFNAARCSRTSARLATATNELTRAVRDRPAGHLD